MINKMCIVDDETILGAIEGVFLDEMNYILQ